MRRIGSILSLSILIVLISCSVCFAAGLELVDSYPENGTGGLQPAGVAMKLHFNEDVSAADIQDANKACMKLVGADKKAIPLKLLHSSSKPKEILVIVDKVLKQNSQYTFTLSEKFQAANGDQLGENIKIQFKTRNTSTDTNINMALMGVMMVGMFYFSSRAMKKQAHKDAEEKAEAAKVNPYKVAKETGKSVEEVVAKTEREKEKNQKKKPHSNGEKNQQKKQIEIEDNSGLKKVKHAKPISQAGSSYTTGRKAAAEKKQNAAAERAKSTNPKNMNGKSKNTKKN